jgi:putative ABC transport system permease protein
VEIVGVVGDVMTSGTRPDPIPAFYVPYAQDPLAVMSFVVRVPSGDPLALGPAAEKAAWALSGGTNVYSVETLERRIADLNWRSRFGALLLGSFAALALLLGTAGVYAVISYSVAQRRAEIGVRMALGARGGTVLGMVLGDALRLALAGVGLGALGALAATRALAGSLYGVSTADPATFAAVTALLLAVATAAGLVPAVRATRLDPLKALKD